MLVQQQDAYKEQARKVCNHREDNHCLYNADHHNPENGYPSCYSHYHRHCYSSYYYHNHSSWYWNHRHPHHALACKGKIIAPAKAAAATTLDRLFIILSI